MKKLVLIFVSICVLFSIVCVTSSAVYYDTSVDFNYQLNIKYQLSPTWGFNYGDVYTTVLPGSLYVNSYDNYYQFTNQELMNIDGDYYRLYDSMYIGAKDSNAYYYTNYGLTCEGIPDENGDTPANGNVIEFESVELQEVFYAYKGVPIPYIVLNLYDNGSIVANDLTGKYVKYTFSAMTPVVSGADGGYTYEVNDYTIINELNGYQIPILPSNIADSYGIAGLARIYELKVELLYEDYVPLTSNCHSVNIVYPSNRLVVSRQAEFASAFSARLLNQFGDEPNYEFDFSLTEFISNSIQPILDIQFAPWLTLGDVIFVFIAFALFIIFLKIFAGG